MVRLVEFRPKMYSWLIRNSLVSTCSLGVRSFSSVRIGYTAMGVLATAAWRGADAGPLSAGDPVENGFALWADPYDDQSDADRAARRAMPVHVALTLAGSLESVVIAVRVQG